MKQAFKLLAICTSAPSLKRYEPLRCNNIINTIEVLSRLFLLLATMDLPSGGYSPQLRALKFSFNVTVLPVYAVPSLSFNCRCRSRTSDDSGMRKLKGKRQVAVTSVAYLHYQCRTCTYISLIVPFTNQRKLLYMYTSSRIFLWHLSSCACRGQAAAAAVHFSAVSSANGKGKERKQISMAIDEMN